MKTPEHLLTDWASFYLLVATASATLMGLTFVIISMLDRPDREMSREGITAFTTPTVVHFGAALLISSLLLMPWPTLLGPAMLVGASGVYGVAHMCRVAVIARRMDGYRPDADDWFWYAIAPLVAYCVMIGGGGALDRFPLLGLFAIAGATLLLLVIGIRNAWDIVTYLTIHRNNGEPPGAASS